jgi:hypothetical protein
MNNLGKKAKDKVTGFTGIITGKCFYLYGCAQYCLVPEADINDMKLREGAWLDDGRIEIIGKGITKKEVKGSDNGGPNIDCPKNSY